MSGISPIEEYGKEAIPGTYLELKELNTSVHIESLDSNSSATTYRLFKRRFSGLLGLVLLNVVTAMSWPWFGPISNNMVADFGFTLNEVNWLGNIAACIYLPTALIMPTVVNRYGIRRCVIALLLSAWLRYAGTAKTLSKRGSYALIIIGQFFVSIAQPIFQVVGPKYSETWFDLRGRTTATMIIAISNPVGGAIGQILSPISQDSRGSILLLGIISSAVIPFVILIGNTPPIPPTYAGSKRSPSFRSFVRAMLGLPTSEDARMTIRERIDFAIIIIVFGTLAGGTNTFGILSAQIMQPVGYSADISGFFGACLLLAGIVAAIVTAPLFDRVFTHRLALTAKFLVPVVGGCWLSLIWAVKPNNTGGLFAIMALLGVCSIPMLPVALELGCELTRNANASSAVLWFAGNLFSIIFVLSQSALRAGPDADPPLNMRRALIFNGIFLLVSACLIFFIEGRQVRKELDEEKSQQPRQTMERAKG